MGGMEIYTDKSSLSTQLREPWFRELKRRGREEGWHARAEEMVAWYPVGGFIARTDLARPFGGGVIVLLSKRRCRDEEGKQKIVRILRYGCFYFPSFRIHAAESPYPRPTHLHFKCCCRFHE